MGSFVLDRIVSLVVFKGFRDRDVVKLGLFMGKIRMLMGKRVG